LEKEQTMRKEISEAVQSKDPDKIRTVAGKYPELGDKNQGHYGNEDIRWIFGCLQKVVNSRRRLISQKLPGLLEDMRTQFAQDGIDPQEQAKT